MRRKLMTSSEMKKSRELNVQAIMDDEIAARANGLSYGQYKAGIKASEEIADTGYKLGGDTYVKPSVRVNQVKKPVVFIKQCAGIR